MKLVENITPTYPGMLVEVIEGVSLNSTYKDNFAEVTVENKLQGEYMNICRVLRMPDNVPDDVVLNATVGDLIGVWATAIKQFKLTQRGDVAIVRNPDVFIVINYGSELEAQILKDYDERRKIQV